MAALSSRIAALIGNHSNVGGGVSGAARALLPAALTGSAALGPDLSSRTLCALYSTCR